MLFLFKKALYTLKRLRTLKIFLRAKKDKKSNSSDPPSIYFYICSFLFTFFISKFGKENEKKDLEGKKEGSFVA